MPELDEKSATPPIKSRMRHYADILNPLFWSDDFNRVDRMFEWACTMVRVTGLKDSGWDSYTESIALLDDLTQLMALELPGDRFPNPANTQARLAVIAYSHMIEMSVPYELLANLLRLRLGVKYSIQPLAHLNKIRDTKVNGVATKRVVHASPIAKIKEIDKLATKAGIPQVGEALKGIYNSTIRNAVYHSDYAIHNGSFRLLSGFHYSKKEKCNTPLITFDELGEIQAKHSLFIPLYWPYGSGRKNYLLISAERFCPTTVTIRALSSSRSKTIHLTASVCIGPTERSAFAHAMLTDKATRKTSGLSPTAASISLLEYWQATRLVFTVR